MRKKTEQDTALDLKADIEVLIASIEHPKKRLFLENFEIFGTVSKAAEVSGISRRSAYCWLNSDDVFSTAFEGVKRISEQALLEKHLGNIRDIAFNPEVKPGARLIASFFEVKKLDPSYRERMMPGGINIGEIVVHSAIPRPNYDDIEGEYSEVPEDT